MSQKFFVTVTVIVCCFVVTCNSLDCYKCTTKHDNPKYCVEINSENQAERTKCTNTDPVCIKIKREVKSNGIVYNKTIRDCTQKTSNTCGDFQQILDGNSPSLANETVSYNSCTICTKNLCNSSKNLMAYVLVTVSMVMITRAF